MIWALIKRDPAWQVMPVVALIVTVQMLFVPSRSGAATLMTLPFIILVGVPGIRQRCTLFQATLPIAAKDLFFSRIAALMACIWVPIFTAAAVTVALRSGRASADYLTVLEAGAVMTMVLLLIHCVRVQTIDPPAGLAVAAYAVTFFSFLTMAETSPQSSTAGIVVLAGCGLVSAALFLKAWADMPKSFQLAPAGPVSTRSGQTKRAWPTPAWWFVFRSLYGWQAGLFLFCTALTMMTGGVLMAAAIIPPAFFVTCRPGFRWLLHLPISARKLFWAMWLPLTVAMIAGMALSIPFEMGLPNRPAALSKTRVLTFAVILLFWLIQICALQLNGWKNLRDKPRTARIILSGAPSFVAYVVFVTPFFLRMAGSKPVSPNPVFDALVRSLASVLPNSLWLIGLIAALPAAGLYCLAEKLFREMEFGQIEVKAQRAVTG